MKKGFYFIAATQQDNEGNQFNAPYLEEGSFEHYGLLMVNRPKNYRNAKSRWKITHIESGASIKAGISLSQARKLVKSLQGFEVWNIKTYNELTSAVSSSEYANDIKAIKALCMFHDAI